jgi:protein tyrosine phosphatase
MKDTSDKEDLLKDINAYLQTYRVERKKILTDVEPDFQFDIARLHYEGWNDFEGISEDDLDKLIAVIMNYQKDSSQPVIVHCRAGVGRSGTLIVACALMHLMKQKKVDSSNLMEHLYRLILEGRKQRGPNFVQQPLQFEALCRWSWRALHRMQHTEN